MLFLWLKIRFRHVFKKLMKLMRPVWIEAIFIKSFSSGPVWTQDETSLNELSN